MSWLDQSAIRSSIGAEGGATLCFFGPPIHFLGGSHCFYPLKERGKSKGWKTEQCPETPVQNRGRGNWRMGLVAAGYVQMPRGSARARRTGLCSTTFEFWHVRQRAFTASSSISGFQCCSCCSSFVCSPSSFRKKLCLLGQPLIAKWRLCSYILVHKERTKWHLTSVYSLLFPNMVFEKCFGYF